MTKSAARVAVDRYVELINARRYDEIADLFAEDAVFLAPTGDRLVGRENIRAFYGPGLAKIAPSRVWVARSVSEGSSCVIEISAELSGEEGGAAHTVVDYFTVDKAGLVTRMAVYLRPEEIAHTRTRLGLD